MRLIEPASGEVPKPGPKLTLASRFYPNSQSYRFRPESDGNFWAGFDILLKPDTNGLSEIYPYRPSYEPNNTGSGANPLRAATVRFGLYSYKS